MYYLKFVAFGNIFDIVMVKAEIISWFSIFEIFSFQSFHIYGIIGSAVVLGAISGAFLYGLARKPLPH